LGERGPATHHRVDQATTIVDLVGERMKMLWVQRI
jgi:hypothetical protein